MLLTGGFGLRRRGSFEAAIEWAEMLDRAVDWWAPQFAEDDQRHARDWIGTGVALATRSATPTNEQWTAVAIVERRAVLESPQFREFWKRSDRYMLEQGASFTALVTGSIEIAAGAVFGSSVAVPGGARGGTLGGAIAAGDDCVGLTAGHVVSAGPEGGIAEQPAAAADDAPTEIGTVIGWSKLRSRHNKADLGLIKLHPHCDNGERSAFTDLGPEGLRELRVRKTGDATGTTVGRVTLINAKKVGVRHGSRHRFFDGIFGIEGEGEEPFAWFGDSGALVFPDDGAAVGGAAVGMVVAMARAYGRSSRPVCFAVGSSAMSDRIEMFLRNSAWTEA